MPIVPVKFRKSSEKLVNYNWADISAGVAYITYYGFSTIEDGTKDYHLSTNVMYSDEIETTETAVTQSWSKRHDLDFDSSEFTKQLTIDGDCFVQLTHGGLTDAGTTSYYTIVKIIKYDGTTETTLGTGNAGSESNPDAITDAGTAYGSDSVTLKINITDKTINPGDILRASVEVYAIKSNASSGYCSFAHSPKNLTGTAIDPDNHNSKHSQFIIDLPVKIN